MMFFMMQSNFVLFAFKLFCDFVKFRLHFPCWHVPKLRMSLLCSFISMFHDKLVIELNSLANVDSLRSRKFVCSLKVVDSSSWSFFLGTSGGVVLVLMILVSDRIVDVPCEINSLRRDKVRLVQETVMLYLAILCLMIRASRCLSCGFWLMDK